MYAALAVVAAVLALGGLGYYLARRQHALEGERDDAVDAQARAEAEYELARRRAEHADRAAVESREIADAARGPRRLTALGELARRLLPGARGRSPAQPTDAASDAAGDGDGGGGAA